MKNNSQEPGHIHFICSVNYDNYEDIMSYNYIINHIVKHEDKEIVCKFKYTVAHEVPLTAYHTN